MWFLYKSMIVAVPLFFFQFYSGYSGLNYYSNVLYAMYGVSCTTVAIFFYLVMDQDVSFKDYLPENDHFKGHQEFDVARLMPKLYQYKIDTHLSQKARRFFWWSLYVWASAPVISYVPFYSMDKAINESGKTGDLWTA